eukprot:jgi/Tetstr1/426139/TSEL_016467.t1
MPRDHAEEEEEVCRRFLASRRVHTAAISLRNTPARWEGCREALERRLPASLQNTFRMVEGVNAKEEALHLLPDVDAVEEALGCRLMRSWPICDEQDVWDRLPDLDCAAGDGVAAWCEYERMFARRWHRDRARLWVDFYCRHLTFGDVGCSLSHLRLWEEAAGSSGPDILIVLEDDSRPLPGAFREICEQIEALERAGTAWDIIMCHSTLYDRAAETPAVGTTLVWAGHRKLTDFYVLSRRGAERLARCGFRECIMPVDDFLPAAFRSAVHPRPDVMRQDCVAQLRASGGGLAALAFPVNLSRNLAKVTGSASIATPCILGDHGAQVGDKGEDGGEEGSADCVLPPWDTERREAGSGEQHGCGHSFSVEVAGQQLDVDWRDGNSWAVVRGGTIALKLLEEAEEPWGDFFTHGTPEAKAACRGIGGRRGELLLWGNGYSSSPMREMFHTVHGALDAQPYPSAKAEASLRTLGAHLKEVCRAIMDVIAPSVARTAQGVANGTAGNGAANGNSSGSDFYAASVMDVFFYPNQQRAATGASGPGNMSAHLDPGYLTITSPSRVPGLWVWGRRATGGGGSGECGQDAGAGEQCGWLDAEALEERSALILLAGSALEDATGGRFAAARHSVASSPAGARLSCVFELRSA